MNMSVLTDNLTDLQVKLQEVAEYLGYKLVTKKEDEESDRWVRVTMDPPDNSQPTLIVDQISYGVQQGRIHVQMLLPKDQWGHAVRGRYGLGECTFDPSRPAKAIAGHIKKMMLDSSSSWHEALAEVKKRHDYIEKQVAYAAALVDSLKHHDIEFTEGFRNCLPPDHNARVDVSYYIAGFGTIEVDASGYRIKPQNFTSPMHLAKAIKMLL